LQQKAELELDRIETPTNVKGVKAQDRDPVVEQHEKSSLAESTEENIHGGPSVEL
jgi:hypothetical protein